ncbi:sensor histidine kinase [Dyadobacter psychrotolerans]|uniref:histidine kinase n=1 Tax=Dyadobacter psychrotolerans TaxID=2541721 RepID=A0A4R5DPD0_9BACT|nr:sensor histidine kinase [Dyadobacter psychrotolerans]TDE15417.1 hypothetical protein E0F88_12965 [Dyadobacter psychrotolerans]
MLLRYLYSILLFVVAIFFLSSCEKQKQLAESGDKAVEEELASLYKKAEDYGNSSPDSLIAIGNRVLATGNRLNNHTAIVRGEKFIARAYWNMANHTEGMKHAVTALRDAEKWGILSEIPNIYGIIGNMHKEKQNYDMALDAADKGMNIAKTLKDTSSIIFMIRLKAMFTQGLGANTKDTAMIHRSLNMHLDGLKIAEMVPSLERARIPYYNNIAQVYVKRNQLDSAEYYVTKAITLAKKYDQQSSLTYSYTWLSQILNRRGEQALSLDYLQKALLISQQIQQPHRQMELYDYLMEGYRSAGKYKEALGAYTRYSDIRDSLQILQNVRQVGELQVQYEAGKKDRQISALGEVNELRSKQTAGALAVLVLVLGLSAVMFSQYRVIRRNNVELAENNRKISEQSAKMQLLMKELHHRVKNNLQIVSNLLSLQGNRLTDDDAKRIIKAGQQRIETMSIIHRSLYSQETVNMVNMRDYINDLLDSIMQSFGIDEHDTDLFIMVGVEELEVDIAMPLGLIINEWITNSFKHAFHDVKRPSITLNLVEIRNQMQLEIKDNGPGFDVRTWEQANRSFGVRLIKVLSKQLEGQCRVIQGSGAFFQLEIPLNSPRRAA